jgi:hypothetical protein
VFVAEAFRVLDELPLAGAFLAGDVWPDGKGFPRLPGRLDDAGGVGLSTGKAGASGVSITADSLALRALGKDMLSSSPLPRVRVRARCMIGNSRSTWLGCEYVRVA